MRYRAIVDETVLRKKISERKRDCETLAGQYALAALTGDEDCKELNELRAHEQQAEIHAYETVLGILNHIHETIEDPLTEEESSIKVLTDQ